MIYLNPSSFEISSGYANSRIQHKKRAQRRLQTKRVGHRRCQKNTALLAKLFRKHGRSSMYSILKQSKVSKNSNVILDWSQLLSWNEISFKH